MTERVLLVKHDSKFTFDSTARADSETGPVIAHVTYRRVMNEGELLLNDPSKKYQVMHKPASVRWELRCTAEWPQESKVMISAHRPKSHSRTLMMTMGNEMFEMTTKSALRDHFVVRRLDSAVDEGAEKGAEVITMDKTFARSLHTIKYSDGLPVELPLFCYWMANLYLKNRRAGQVSLRD